MSNTSSLVDALEETPTPPKKYVTRACDECKKRKSKCDGLQPCHRCPSVGVECSYRSTYNRVEKRRRYTSRILPGQLHTQSEPLDPLETSTIPEFEQTNETLESRTDDRDASTHTFLKRVYTHLKSMGQLFPRNLSRPAEELFVESIPKISLLPLARNVAEDYIECFYSHSNATYRYVPRKQIEDLLNGFYLQKETVLRDDAGMAILFMVLAIGYCGLYAARFTLKVDD